MDAKTIEMTYDFTFMVLNKNTEGVTHEMSLVAPPPGGNCMNWVLVHILSTRIPILKLAVADPIWTDAEAETYRRGSRPLAPGRVAEARPFPSLLADLARTQEALKAALSRITPEQLAAPGLEAVPGGLQPVGTQLAVFNFHESYHSGQIGILRRFLGMPGAIQ